MIDLRSALASRRGGFAAAVLVGVVLLGFSRWLLATSAAPSPASLPLLLGDAKKANSVHDIDEERTILLHAEELEGRPEEVFEVQRRLAVLDWKYAGTFDEARTRLLASIDTSAVAAWLAIARLEHARQRFNEAASAARAASGLATTALEADDARVALARAVVTSSLEERMVGRPGLSDALVKSHDDLRSMVSENPGYLEPSRLLLQAALLLHRGESVLLAWRSFFHVATNRTGPSLVAGIDRELEALLPQWQRPNASSQVHIALIGALTRSRLFTEAVLVALAPSSPEEVRSKSQVRAVIAYAGFLREVRGLTEEHYRLSILGREDRSGWLASLTLALEPLARAMDGHELEVQQAGAAMNVDRGRLGGLDASLVESLGQAFGTYLSIGTTAGYFDLHMGHLVSAESRTVKQYGRVAQLSFFALENMVSNGFQSWAWESGAQHGGWNKPNGIYQVRPAYVGRGLRLWRRLQSDSESTAFLQEMSRETVVDASRAANDPYSYLPGLAMRLEHQGLTSLLEELRAGGYDGDDLKIAFLWSYDEATLESSIFAHEGRHAIDRLERSILSFARNSEFTAKLSEVAFAPRPRLALGAIIDANIGGTTPHGRANLAVMKGLVKWMRSHKHEISGFDAVAPVLPQLDLLTDEQLRRACRSMDRLAPSR